MAMRAVGLDPQKELIKSLAEDSDEKGDIEIDCETFIEIITQTILEKDTRKEIVKAFRFFDKDEHGYITAEDFHRVANELGADLTDVEVRNIITEANGIVDGQISEEEFVGIMTQI